jgi:ATP-dependent Lhr-like helicase
MGGVLSFALCQAMMQTLMDPGPEISWLTPVASRTLEELRAGYEGLLEDGSASLEDHGANVQWHTFAGGGINRLLAAGLESLTGDKWITGNLTLKSKVPGIVKARDAVRQLRELDWEALATVRAHELTRGRLSKFQPCLTADANLFRHSVHRCCTRSVGAPPAHRPTSLCPRGQVGHDPAVAPHGRHSARWITSRPRGGR